MNKILPRPSGAVHMGGNHARPPFDDRLSRVDESTVVFETERWRRRVRSHYFHLGWGSKQWLHMAFSACGGNIAFVPPP